MKTPKEEPTGPRGPRTTSPDSDQPAKQQEKQAQEKDASHGENASHGEESSQTDVEERHQTEPPRPHGDPLRREIAR